MVDRGTCACPGGVGYPVALAARPLRFPAALAKPVTSVPALSIQQLNHFGS